MLISFLLLPRGGWQKTGAHTPGYNFYGGMEQRESGYGQRQSMLHVDPQLTGMLLSSLLYHCPGMLLRFLSYYCLNMLSQFNRQKLHVDLRDHCTGLPEAPSMKSATGQLGPQSI